MGRAGASAVRHHARDRGDHDGLQAVRGGAHSGSVQPTSVQPISVQPISVQPISVQPISAQPISGQPAGRQWAHWLGRYGEQAAAQYLIGAGYQLLDRNWACRDPDLRGELDLVARYRRIVVACEIKTRAGDLLAHPAQAVTEEKAARLRLLATRWLREHQRGAPASLRRATGLRIDVIAIRTDPRPPYPLRSLDHLIGVA